MAARWGDSVSEDRASELEVLLRQWRQNADESERTGPFNGYTLTGADVYWLERHHSGQTQTEPLNLDGARLNEADLRGAQLFGVRLQGAYLDSADLSGANLVRANLRGARLQRANLRRLLATDARLETADLRVAVFDRASEIQNVKLNGVFLEGTIFNGVDLSVVDWSIVHTLGDETAARGAAGYQAAARAYRSLSLNLRSQGLVTDAARFHYRAEVMARSALRAQAGETWHSIGWRSLLSRTGEQVPGKLANVVSLSVRWLLSWVLGSLAGYGVYHIWRLFVTYVVAVLVFAVIYYASGPHPVPERAVMDSLVLSVTSFHGRGLQPAAGVNDTMRVCAGVEAVVGLFIEALFVAAFTRRIMRG